MRVTQRKGDIATAKAIHSFTENGWDVAIPLTESAPYDLIVDTGSAMYKVQVRFSSHRDVGLRRIHSNSKGYVVKKMTEKVYDWLYVLCQDGEYLVTDLLIGRSYITMNSRYALADFFKSFR